MRAFGVQKNERVGRLVEGIKLLREIWSDEELHHHGKFYQLDGYRIVPKPAQKPSSDLDCGDVPTAASLETRG